MYDLIVIGGGPAALSAAFFAAGKQLSAVMIYEDLGGKIGWLESLVGPGYNPYLPGNELAHLLTVSATTRVNRTISDRVVRIEPEDEVFSVVTENHGSVKGRTVLIATGASPLQLSVPGADRFAERGIGYSMTTHSHLVRDRSVAVIGGTLRALSGAAELAYTAAKIYVIAPDALNMTTPLGHALAQRPNVEVLEGYEVREMVGDEASLRELVLSKDGEEQRIEVDRAFVALGLVPNTQIVRDLVETDADGFIMVNAYHETSMPGIYAAGDACSTFSEQVLIAIGDGARAARSAYDYLLAQWLVPDGAEIDESAVG
jgi:thioredoxin reductase